MGSRLSRQSSLQDETEFSKKKRQQSPGEAGASGGGDFLFTSLILKSDKLPGMLKKNNPAPYTRRVGWIRDIQALIRECKVEQAVDVIKLLRKVKTSPETECMKASCF